MGLWIGHVSGMKLNSKTYNPQVVHAGTLHVHSTFWSTPVRTVTQLSLKENCIMHRKTFKYLHTANTSVFIIIITSKQAEFHLAATIFGRVT